MTRIDLSKLVKAKFQKQNATAKLPTTCPHCGNKLVFEFKHTQDTSVETELVKLEKEE